MPVEIGFKTNLIATPQIVKQRLRLYRDAGITTLQMKPSSEPKGRIDDPALFAELVTEVSGEVIPQDS